jgi:flagellar basal-body rod protein FlgB
MELFDQSLTILEKTLDVRMVGQRLTAANLANINTPGYTAQKLDFKATMDRIMADPDADKTDPVIAPSSAVARTLDGNNVDLETELGELSRNRLMYSLTSQLIAAKFRQMASVIDGEG